jgi:hypothetical protein
VRRVSDCQHLLTPYYGLDAAVDSLFLCFSAAVDTIVQMLLQLTACFSLAAAVDSLFMIGYHRLDRDRDWLVRSIGSRAGRVAPSWRPYSQKSLEPVPQQIKSVQNIFE